MSHDRTNTTARALGLTSVGIGVAELAAPRQVQSLLGLEERNGHRGILRVLGVREIMHGIDLLSAARAAPQLTAGIYARVAGDVLDSALLAIAATRTRRPLSFAAATASVMAIGAIDLLHAARVPRRSRR